MMNYNERYATLNSCFHLGRDCNIEKTRIQIRFLNFNSFLTDEERGAPPQSADVAIPENFSFKYPVFVPDSRVKYERAILLLHGLNERTWNKYLTWAEYLSLHAGVPVVLFPIAYHINRAPVTWANPRMMVDALNHRKEQYWGERSISYANIALSERLSEHPDRFYLSGRQTLIDLAQLFEEIKGGRHPFLKEGADINIFAYSIGAFLAQVALMDNRNNLFSDSRLFMFCGGSIFSSMFGVSRSIMDKPAFKKLRQYYIHIFGNEPVSFWKRDNAFTSFWRMITPERYKEERETFFSRAAERIGGIALSKDEVIPYHGVKEAMGDKNADLSIRLQDFPFIYTHENPFPHNEKDAASLNKAFEEIFSAAASFLATS